MTRSVKLLAAVALIAAAAITASAIAGLEPVPVLAGPNPMSGEGFGHVKPPHHLRRSALIIRTATSLAQIFSMKGLKLPRRSGSSLRLTAKNPC
jgi:hypothetical protein